MASRVDFPSHTPFSTPPHTIMVGNPRIAHLFSEVMRQYGSTTPVETDPVVKYAEEAIFGEDCTEGSIFGRDRGVVSPNHIYLLPYPIEDTYLFQAEYKAHLSEGSPFIDNPKKLGVGIGFHNQYVKAAWLYAKKHHLPFYLMRSTIEGGNCHLFFDSKGTQKAIVGSHSVALTLMGLEKQKFFEKGREQEILQQLLSKIDSPDDEFVRKARNMVLFIRQKAWDDRRNFYRKNASQMSPEEAQQYKAALEAERTMPGGISDYEKLLLAPLTKKDRARYREEGRIWQAKAKRALQVIAEDLGVSEKDVAFPRQKSFHIDMDMFVGLNGNEVYLDEKAADPDVIKALQDIHCKVIVVHGVDEVGTQSINFMNGLFVSTPEGPLFVTNGTRKDKKSLQLRARFVQEVTAHIPNLRIHFLDETQKILTQDEGGIHCLTWERPNYATPLDILLSYIDAPIPYQIIRQRIEEILPCLNM